MSCPGRPAPLELILNHDDTSYDNTAANMITVSVGTPLQQLRLVPSTLLPNIGLHDVSVCPGETTKCADLLGGVFDGDNSATRVLRPFDKWNGTQDDGLDPAAHTFFNDDLNMLTNKLIHGVPMMTLESNSQAAGILPIGANSTFISEVVKADLVPSQSWGLYMGTKTNPGSLILGGYSNGFMTESLRARDSRDDCPICFKVTGMTFQQPSGDAKLIPHQDGGVFMASLEPYANYISVPGYVFDDFVKATNGTVGPNDFVVYEDGQVPPGDIRIHLGNSLETIIPHELIFIATPPIFNGKQMGLNADSKMARIRRSGNGQGVLGLPYMSMVYLVYDNERASLSISNAQELGSSNGQLVKICPLANSDRSNPSPSITTKNNKAKLIGGTAGAAAGLIIIVIIVLVYFRLRQRRTSTLAGRETDSEMRYTLEHPSKDSIQPSLTSSLYSYQELGPKSVSAEMPVLQTPVAAHVKEMQSSPSRINSRLIERSLYEMPVDTTTQIDVVGHNRNGSAQLFHSQDDDVAVDERTSFSDSTISWGATNTPSEDARTLVSSPKRSEYSGPFSNVIRAGKASEQWNHL